MGRQRTAEVNTEQLQAEPRIHLLTSGMALKTQDRKRNRRREAR